MRWTLPYAFGFLLVSVLGCANVPIEAPDSNDTGDSSAAIIPPIPTNFTLTGVTPYSATVAWDESYGTKAEILKYEIQINSEGDPSVTSAPATSKELIRLSAETTYDFRIRACSDNVTCSDYSENISINTLAAPDTSAPSVPTGLIVTGKTVSSIAISWNASTDNTGVVRYEVQTNSTGTPVTVMAPTTSRNMTGLNESTTYQFRVRACDASSNCSAYTSNISSTTNTSPDTTAPSVPTGLAAGTITTNSIMISWNASTDNVGVVRYEVQTNSTGTPASVMAPTTNRNMTGLNASTTYQFRVRACDNANNCSAYTSNISPTTMSAADTTAPSVPTGLTVGTITSSSIAISWNASTDNVGVTRYEVQTNSSGTPVAVSAPTTARTMTGLNASTTYQFRVRACDNANNCSGYTSNQSGTTLVEAAAPTIPGTLASKKAVSMYAAVQNSPAKIIVKWAKVNGVNQSSASLYRRTKGTSRGDLRLLRLVTTPIPMKIRLWSQRPMNTKCSSATP
ncbi:MAG: fibronectin type III domain-containing protein [Bdellovibrionota bacterium]